MNNILILYTIFTLSSCSILKSKNDPAYLSDYKSIKGEDYISFYSSLGLDYRKFNSKQIIELRGRSHTYLLSIYKKLKKNNELLFKKESNPRFYISLSERPFSFTLPNGQYYLSSGLLRKYLKNEDLLIAVMAAETIRWQRDLYPMRIKVPVGYITTKEILDLIRLPLKVKNELNKWSYNVIKRAGVDASVYLNWLQLQNKSILDFSLMLGNVNSMAKEEFLFKDFLIKIDIFDSANKNERSSGDEFYKLQNKIRRIYETRKI